MPTTHAAPDTTGQQDQDPPQCILCWNGTPAELLVRLRWLLWDGATLAERDETHPYCRPCHRDKVAEFDRPGDHVTVVRTL